MRRVIVAIALLGAALSCGDGEPQGPTVLFTARVLEFSLSGGFPVVPDAEVCVIGPEAGDCATSNEGGFAEVRVPPETDVLLAVTADGFTRYLVPLRSPAEDFSLEFPVIPENLTDAVALSLDVELETGAGRVVTVVEPAAASNAGVTFELVDPATGASGGSAFYFGESGLPDPEATGTSSSGFGGFPNVAPGEWFLLADFNERCTIRRGWQDTAGDGTTVMRVPVEAGAITSVEWSNCAAP